MNEDFLTLDQYPATKRKVESVFFDERRLPEQVFKRPYQFQLLSEFDFAMADILAMLRENTLPFG